MTKEEKELLNKQKEDFGALRSLANTDGGKLLVEALTKDALNSIERFANQYKTLTHQEFIALGAEVSIRLGLLRTLSRAEKNEKEVVSLLKDALL
jgi:hypothetical protein